MNKKNRRITVTLSEEAAEFLSKIPWGMRSLFVDFLILEATKRFKSPTEVTAVLLEKTLKETAQEEEHGETKKEKAEEKRPAEETKEQKSLGKLEKWAEEFY